MKRVLVTGGAGFIASHLVDKLVDNGHKVTVIDNLSSGKQEHLNNMAKFVNGDIRDKKTVNDLFKQHGPFDVIFHQASQKSVTHSVADPIEDAQINIVGGLTILEAARTSKVRQVIFSSTGGALYGDGVPIPTKEDEKIDPLSPYGIAKLSFEKYLRFYQELGIITQILRYSNVYGPRQDPQGEAGVVAIFCQKIINNEELTIFGDGEQTRDFIYVSDVVDANIAVLNLNDNGYWNIGTGKETSVNTIARTLINCAHKPNIKISHQEARLGELRRSVIDPSKAKEQLNWSAKVNVEEGLKKTFVSFVNK